MSRFFSLHHQFNQLFVIVRFHKRHIPEIARIELKKKKKVNRNDSDGIQADCIYTCIFMYMKILLNEIVHHMAERLSMEQKMENNPNAVTLWQRENATLSKIFQGYSVEIVHRVKLGSRKRHAIEKQKPKKNLKAICFKNSFKKTHTKQTTKQTNKKTPQKLKIKKPPNPSVSVEPLVCISLSGRGTAEVTVFCAGSKNQKDCKNGTRQIKQDNRSRKMSKERWRTWGWGWRGDPVCSSPHFVGQLARGHANLWLAWTEAVPLWRHKGTASYPWWQHQVSGWPRPPSVLLASGGHRLQQILSLRHFFCIVCHPRLWSPRWKIDVWRKRGLHFKLACLWASPYLTTRGHRTNTHQSHVSEEVAMRQLDKETINHICIECLFFVPRPVDGCYKQQFWLAQMLRVVVVGGAVKSLLVQTLPSHTRLAANWLIGWNATWWAAGWTRRERQGACARYMAYFETTWGRGGKNRPLVFSCYVVYVLFGFRRPSV